MDRNACPMCPEQKPPCFIVLGRYGDIIQLLPAFKAVGDRTGLQPVIISSVHYANVFEGVSYVQVRPVHWEWWQGVPQARQLATELYGGGVVVQWWHDDPRRIKLIEQANDGGVVLQSHGHNWGVNINEWPDYGTSMWDRAGFTAEEMQTLPLVFDKRDPVREQNLVRTYGHKSKPMLLVNFSGVSSPFGPHPEVMGEILKLSQVFHIVELGGIKATRIYDLLGLMDAAAGMVTIDTATLHLALASRIPYIAYTRGPNDWCRSVPKGNCVREIHYGDAIARLNEVVPILQSWAAHKPERAVLAGGGGGGVLA